MTEYVAVASSDSILFGFCGGSATGFDWPSSVPGNACWVDAHFWASLELI